MIVPTLSAGVALGLAVAVPIGSMGMLCIQRTIALGVLGGVATGLGAATVHAVYGATAMAGFGLVMQVVEPGGVHVASLPSAALLFFLGSRCLKRKISLSPVGSVSASGLAASFGCAMAFGFTNPLTPLLFATMTPVLVPSEQAGRTELVALGVFIGSVVWWVVLSLAVAMLRSHLNARVLNFMNAACGLALGSLAVVITAKVLGAVAHAHL